MNGGGKGPPRPSPEARRSNSVAAKGGAQPFAPIRHLWRRAGWSGRPCRHCLLCTLPWSAAATTMTTTRRCGNRDDVAVQVYSEVEADTVTNLSERLGAPAARAQRHLRRQHELGNSYPLPLAPASVSPSLPSRPWARRVSLPSGSRARNAAVQAAPGGGSLGQRKLGPNKQCRITGNFPRTSALYIFMGPM